MQYKLIENSKNDTNDVIGTVLLNRGINNPNKYLNLTEDCICNWEDLDRINEAVECFVEHFERQDIISILVDSDPDGYSSASMMYSYIKLMDEDYPVYYMLHKKNKAHGLNDNDFDIPENTKLLIIPDAGTNDCEECNNLIERGISVICLDHHEQNNSEVKNNAIIVNNQISNNYSNKDFCGAGVTYEFLRALDEYYWNEFASEFIDLVSFGNISDVMDLRSMPTRYYVEEGFKNLKNPALLAMIKAQEFSMHGEVNIHNVSWYITPIFNAMIRIGTFEERELLFRAFIGDYEEFDYKKRGGEIIAENIYDRAARLCKNAKSRQDKMRDKLFASLLQKSDVSNKVVMIQTEEGDSGIIGLSAMRLADTLSRPVIVVKPIEKDGDTILSGSCRNFNNSPVEDLKSAIDDTGLFELAAGHANAAGVQIKPENFESAQAALNEELKDVIYDPSYQCDFILDIDDLDITLIRDIDSARWIWCTGISEPKLAIENICITRKDITVQGKDSNSIFFMIDNIKFVQFKMVDGDPLYDFVNSWTAEDDDEIEFNVVGTCSINNYNNVLTPQFVINDVQTIQNYSING